MDKLQTQHNALQAELAASRDVLSAREREVEVLRMRCEEAEREVDSLRDDLSQAQQRINTLLDMGGDSFGVGSDDDRRQSLGSATSEEASMAFDKVSGTSEIVTGCGCADSSSRRNSSSGKDRDLRRMGTASRTTKWLI